MSKLVSFSILENDVMTPEDIETSQFQKVHFRIYSADRVNAHGYSCSLKVLKRYAKTICGKPILAYYNRFANGGHGDLAGHEDSDWAREYPIGFFPENTKIIYEKDENGTIYLCADGYIWNVYYSHITELFKKNEGKKGVSSEMLIIDSEVIEETNVEEILQYSFTGVTVLGDTDAYGNPIAPAVEGCQGVLVTNSVMNEEYQKAKKEFEKMLNAVKQGSVETDSFFIEKNKKEEGLMEKDKKTNTAPSDVVENAEQVVTTKVKVSTDTRTYDDHGFYIGSSSESHKKETTRVMEVPDDQANTPALSATEEVDSHEEKKDKAENSAETQEPSKSVNDPKKEKVSGKDSETPKQENACKENNESSAPVKEKNTCKTDHADQKDTPKEENTCVVSQNAEDDIKKEDNATVSRKDYEELKKMYDTTLLKCKKLEEYKNNRDSEDMKNAVEIALNGVSHILNADQIDEWRKESAKYSYSQLDDFRNKLKAFAFDISEKNGIPQKETLRNSIPMCGDDESMDIWDRISKNYV